MGLSKQLVYIGDFAEEARRLKSSWGKTTLYSTGHAVLDKYIGGGFGRDEGYEVMVLYGPTGVGKSMVGLNLLIPAIMKGIKVGMLILEDGMADASVRMSFMMEPSDYQAMNASETVRCLPEDALVRSWKLDDLLTLISQWFEEGVDLIFLDHLQFAFENADAIRGENEYVAQRVFMQKLNQLVKKLNKTIILVSHVNKQVGAKGMDKIVGSGAIPAAATKVIEVAKNDIEGQIRLNMRKSRFTSTPSFHFVMKLDGAKMEPAA